MISFEALRSLFDQLHFGIPLNCHAPHFAQSPISSNIRQVVLMFEIPFFPSYRDVVAADFHRQLRWIGDLL